MMASRGDIQAGGAFVRLFLKNDLTKSLGTAMRATATAVATAGAAVVGLGAAAGAGIGVALNHFSKFGSELHDMSQRTGVAAGSLAELKFAAEQTGAGFEDVETALKKFAKGGHDVKDFDAMAESINGIADPSERARQAIENFGKGGTKLLPMFTELKSLREEARSLGLAPNDDEIQRADRLGDSFDKLKAVFSSSLFKIGAAFAPIITPIAEGIAKLIGQFNQWISTNNQVFNSLRVIGDYMAEGQWQTAAEIAWAGIKLAFMEGTASLRELWAIAKTVALQAWDGIQAGIATVFVNAFSGVEAAWVNTVSFFESVWSKFSTMVASSWQKIQQSIGNLIISALEKTGMVSKEFASAWRESLNEPINQSVNNRGNSAQQQQADIEKRRQARLAEIEGNRTGANSILQEDKKRNQDQRTADLAKDLEAQRAALEKSRGEFAKFGINDKSNRLAGPAGAKPGGEDEFGKHAASVATSAAGAMALQGGANSTALGVAKQSYAELKEIRRQLAENAKQKIVLNAV